MARTHVRAENRGLASGWRVWRVIRDEEDGLPALASTERDFVWRDRSARARCLPPSLHFGVSEWYRDHRRTPDHAPPATVCGCGIHAYWERSDAFGDSTLGRGTLRAIGPVELSERMIATESGVRAEAARIVRPIWLVGECGITRRDLSVCGSVTAMDRDTFSLRCSDHAPPGWPDAEPAIWALQQRLEGRYQVEVHSTVKISERLD
ncbi:MAG: hypothetical protein JJE47_09120 [Acidimicrobiia bacterium]|nr:hypothetical protein [Acidimicrobiia bacterium]